MIAVLVAALGVFVAVLIVVVLAFVLGRRAARGTAIEHEARTAQAAAVVLEVQSTRRNVRTMGLADYRARVRFTGLNGCPTETWADVLPPPRGWQVPGQQVMLVFDPKDPSSAHVNS